jgi:hypothetical protein
VLLAVQRGISAVIAIGVDINLASSRQKSAQLQFHQDQLEQMELDCHHLGPFLEALLEESLGD